MQSKSPHQKNVNLFKTSYATNVNGATGIKYIGRLIIKNKIIKKLFLFSVIVTNFGNGGQDL